jgi:GMP synthase-like glutamine amidotransferase
MTRIHCFQHVPFEPAAHVAGWAEEHHYPLTTTHLYNNETPPAPDDYDWLAVMGGPMGIGDTGRHPWLTAEMGAIEAAFGAGKTVVGICLGAQMIAHVLGARVYKHDTNEIGWFPVTLSEAAGRHPLMEDVPESFTAFHWHGETFDLPAGAVPLARSEATPHQMFAHGPSIVGIQFHLEMTAGVIAALAEHNADQLVDAPYVQTRDEVLAENTHLQSGHDILDSILSRL